MKRIKISFAILILLLLGNCSKEESIQVNPEKEQELEIYFTLNVDADIDTSDTDNWLIIHDDKGKLIDFRPYESGSKLEFKASKDSLSDRITVTEFAFSKDYVNDLNDGTTPQTQSEIGLVHEIRTFTDLEKGSMKNITAASEINYSPEESIETGKFELKIDDIPQIRSMDISTEIGKISFGYSSGSGTDLKSYEYNLDKFQNEKEYIVSIIDGNNSLKYKSFFVSDNLENLSLKYSEFEDFDSYLEIDVPDNINYSLDVGGFEESQEMSRFGGYSLLSISANSTYVETKPLKFGYLDRFKKFRTLFYLKTDKIRYNFHKYGDKPERLEIPIKPNLIIENPSVYDFRFTSDLDFDEMTHLWRYTEGRYPLSDYSVTKWFVNTSSAYNQPVIGEIPEEILELYPKINISNIEYLETSINLLAKEDVGSIFDLDCLTIIKE